ncbi:hypothetical protein O3P69_002765 [Scylla paramamosain]|uniref:Uncharacterized protein n=1 Tax=Scylla paramamosain TaxID=85552 RepID=A0AAW0USK4_SCYPA
MPLLRHSLRIWRWNASEASPEQLRQGEQLRPLPETRVVRVCVCAGDESKWNREWSCPSSLRHLSSLSVPLPVAV